MITHLYKPIINYPHRCVICGKKIKIGSKQVLVHVDSQDSHHYVHYGECWEEYQRILHSPEAQMQGYIVGICAKCRTPVRTKQPHELVRNVYGKYMRVNPKEDTAWTMPPSKLNGHWCDVVHTRCLEEANRQLEKEMGRHIPGDINVPSIVI